MAYTISPEEFKRAYDMAPQLVQNVLNDASTEKAVDGIRATHQLHVDIVGKLSELLDHLLLGLISPSDFYQELLSLGVQKETANAVVKEINEKIFQPLQQKMRSENVAVDSREGADEEDEDEEAIYDPRFDIPSRPQTFSGAREALPLTPVMQVGNSAAEQPALHAPTPVSPYTNQQASQQSTTIYSHASELVGHQNTPMPSTVHPPASFAPGSFSPAHQPAPQPTPQPATASIAPGSTAPTPSEPYLPYARTMAEDMERAAHGLTGQPATPARSFQTASVPVTFAQPRAIPAEVGYSPAPASAAPPAPAQPSTPIMAPVRLTPVDRPHSQSAPITKEFGSDPYREPISV